MSKPTINLKAKCASQHFGHWLCDAEKLRSARDLFLAGAWPTRERMAARPDAEAGEVIVGKMRGGEFRTLYTVRDGIAHVSIEGLLAKGVSSLGGSSYMEIREAMRMSADDETVRGIVLHVDSPGGTADGSFDAADDIHNASAVKPVVAYVEGLAASGGYLLASQADAIIASPSSWIGSIGVYSVVEDRSKQYKSAGVDVHVMSTGPYKGAFIEGAPVTEAQLADEQRVVNEIHQMFLAAVERGRGTPVGGVDDGRVWLAQQAGEQFGLVDAVGDYESALSVINKRMNDMEADRFQAFAAKPENIEKIVALPCVVSMVDAARTEAAAQAKAEAIAEIKARIDAAEGDAKLAFELASVEEITSTIAARKAAAEKAAIDAKLAEADKLKIELDAARADLARERANKITVVGTTSAVSEGVAVNTVQADPDPASIAAAEWESASEAERLTWASREVYVAYRTKTNSK